MSELGTDGVRRIRTFIRLYKLIRLAFQVKPYLNLSASVALLTANAEVWGPIYFITSSIDRELPLTRGNWNIIALRSIVQVRGKLVVNVYPVCRPGVHNNPPARRRVFILASK